MFPPLELCAAESTHAVLCYIMRIFRDLPKFELGKGRMYIGFDDMCHLARYAQAHRHEHRAH